jgi:hypothetical protein
MKKHFRKIFLLVIFAAVVFTVWKHNEMPLTMKVHENMANAYSYPEDVTLNFYKWYASCLEEMEENRQLLGRHVCYQKTTYITPGLVGEIDQGKKHVLCNQKEISFYTIGVLKQSEADNDAQIAVYQTNPKAFIANVHLQKHQANWLISDISCTDPAQSH